MFLQPQATIQLKTLGLIYKRLAATQALIRDSHRNQTRPSLLKEKASTSLKTLLGRQSRAVCNLVLLRIIDWLQMYSTQTLHQVQKQQLTK
jgi:hypothetical protein